MKSNFISFSVLLATALAVTLGVGSVSASAQLKETRGVITDVNPTVPPTQLNVLQGGSANTLYAPPLPASPAPVGLPSVRILSDVESAMFEQQALLACATTGGVFLETRIFLPNGGAYIRTCRPAQEAARAFEEQVEAMKRQQQK